MVGRLGENTLKPAVVSYYESAIDEQKRQMKKNISTNDILRLVGLGYTEQSKYNKMEKTPAFRM